jgi:hypothetical protein
MMQYVYRIQSVHRCRWPFAVEILSGISTQVKECQGEETGDLAGNNGRLPCCLPAVSDLVCGSRRYEEPAGNGFMYTLLEQVSESVEKIDSDTAPNAATLISP